ncbi:DUF3307 domain-containing protein [Embleya sp. MST-111070]|uniref:DUF3307 domain-containing protein n=1 Tax=Embleya sp. MST-111070 TaxID=3398231 RepID=UPI003F73D95B
MSADPGVFAAIGFALYAAHMVGDHWVQSDREALGKGAAGWSGRFWAARHVVSLTLVKVVFLAAVWLVFALALNPFAVVVGLVVDALSHWWADRRHTLAGLARRVGKGTWWERDPQAPYLLDQSWHIGWLFVAALIVTGVTS